MPLLPQSNGLVFTCEWYRLRHRPGHLTLGSVGKMSSDMHCPAQSRATFMVVDHSEDVSGKMN